MKQKRPVAEPLHADNKQSPEAFERDLKVAFTFNANMKYGKAFSDLPPGKLRLLTALRYYYAYSHNGFVLLEALELCKGVNPPTWVLEALIKGFDQFNNGKKLTRALALGKRDREEYEQFRKDRPIMADIWKKVQSGRSLESACESTTDDQGRHPDSVRKQYEKFWKGFFEYVSKR